MIPCPPPTRPHKPAQPPTPSDLQKRKRMPLHRPAGWLTYTGPDVAITGKVISWEITTHHQYRHPVSATFELAEPWLTRGATQGWPRDTPDMLALLTLARRHQAEYEQLREAEHVLHALGGTGGQTQMP